MDRGATGAGAGEEGGIYTGRRRGGARRSSNHKLLLDSSGHVHASSHHPYPAYTRPLLAATRRQPAAAGDPPTASCTLPAHIEQHSSVVALRLPCEHGR